MAIHTDKGLAVCVSLVSFDRKSRIGIGEMLADYQGYGSGRAVMLGVAPAFAGQRLI